MTAEKLDAGEIVRALRRACHGCDPTPCCEYEVLGGEAAAMIESLTARAEAAEAALAKEGEK